MSNAMHPVLFSAFGTPVHAYALASVLGYGIGVLLGFVIGRRDGRPWADLFDMAIVAVVGGLLGSKLFHTLFEARGHKLADGSVATGLWDLLRDDPWHWARLFEPGYVFYGGVIGAAGLMWLFALRRGIADKGAIGDYATPGILAGIGVGRVGCFLAGCCYGAPTDLPWGVHFPAEHASHGLAVHPVQLVDSAFGVLGLAVCAAWWKRRRFSGEALCATAASYAVYRFGTELLRADADRGVWWGGHLSTSQIVSLCALPVVLLLWRRALRMARAGVLRNPRDPLEAT
jgi:phosphatidylglycerol:prolipoprotein diacylglycerol transferase